MKLRKTFIILTFSIGLTGTVWAAYPVTDSALIATVKTGFNAIAMQMSSFQGALTLLLNQIGSAINQNGSKVATTIEAAAKSDREFQTEKARQERLTDAKAKFQISDSICSESASGGANTVSSGSFTAKGTMRPGGGGVSNSTVSNAVNKPALTPSADAARSAKIHAQYCDNIDFESFGGTQACPVVSKNMPGADKRVDSVLNGAGPDGKAPDLTFTQEQTDAARMYIQNSVYRSVSKDLAKAEANSAAGIQYLGLKNQMYASLSAAADPQEKVLAERQPIDETKALITEALQSKSAKSYFDATVSDVVKKTGKMSKGEFLQFEVGRRYANTEYQSDLQAMDTDNIAREQIRVTSLTNWLLLDLRNEIQTGNIIAGQQLASQIRNEYEPLLNQQYQSIGARAGGE